MAVGFMVRRDGHSKRLRLLERVDLAFQGVTPDPKVTKLNPFQRKRDEDEGSGAA